MTQPTVGNAVRGGEDVRRHVEREVPSGRGDENGSANGTLVERERWR